MIRNINTNSLAGHSVNHFMRKVEAAFAKRVSIK